MYACPYMDNPFLQSSQYMQGTFLGTNKIKDQKIENRQSSKIQNTKISIMCEVSLNDPSLHHLPPLEVYTTHQILQR